MITRDNIKNYIEAQGFDANVKIEGDQKTWKVTLKSSFEIPATIINVTDPIISACLARHILKMRRTFDIALVNLENI